MLQVVRELVVPTAQARVLLLINHVISREAAAIDRLRSHAGRRLRLELGDVPGWLPAVPPMRVVITPAGLFEGDAGAPDAAPDLTLRLPMPTPAQLLEMASGAALPDVRLDGAADLAADMHWLVDNLRWDIESDLAEVLGAAPARVVMSVGRAGASALRRMAPGARPVSPQPDSASR
jgi:ubiquinone biosynthesis protein UbiJ